MSKNNSMWNTSRALQKVFFFCIKCAFPAKNVKRYVLTFLKSAIEKCISRPKCVRGASEAIGKPKTLELRDRQYTPVASSHTTPCHTIPYHTTPYRTKPYHTIPYHTIPHHAIPYHTISHQTIPYHKAEHASVFLKSPGTRTRNMQIIQNTQNLQNQQNTRKAGIPLQDIYKTCA